jgi:SAM-dependent methyltransferase
MLQSDHPDHLKHYIDDSRSGIANIEESLAAAGRSFADVESCLDFASGYGRITRLLVAHLSPDRVTAYDIDRNAVRFCASEFGVRPLYPYRGRRPLPSRTYDLIFVGSLFTHLPWSTNLVHLDFLVDSLRQHGILVFSTQGESCLSHLDWYGPEFAAAEHTYRREVAATGIYFLPYARARSRDYGITIHARAFVEVSMRERFARELTLVRFAERGWDKHQDVWSYQRT